MIYKIPKIIFYSDYDERDVEAAGPDGELTREFDGNYF